MKNVQQVSFKDMAKMGVKITQQCKKETRRGKLNI